MVIERSAMVVEKREHMREGKGTCELTLLGGRELQKHCRILSEIVIPAGASIGPHQHSGETEYYIILEGNGLVDDNGTPTPVKPGDCVVTGGGAVHSIEATGGLPLRMIAMIVTDA